MKPPGPWCHTGSAPTVPCARHPSSRVPRSHPGPEPDNKSPLPWLQATAAVTFVSDLLGALLRDQEQTLVTLQQAAAPPPPCRRPRCSGNTWGCRDTRARTLFQSWVLPGLAFTEDARVILDPLPGPHSQGLVFQDESLLSPQDYARCLAASSLYKWLSHSA